MQVQREQKQTTPTSSGPAPATARADAEHGPALRGTSYAAGAQALAPEGQSFAAGAAALTPVQRQREGGRRDNPYVDPARLPADHGKANVKNRDWSWRGVLFANGVKATDVHQTNINDCYLVAVLASIANEQPGYIKSIIRSDSPGKYAVRFFEKRKDGKGYQQVWIAVDGYLPTTLKAGKPDEIRYGHSVEKDAAGKRELWPSIIEKAYAKLKGNYSDIDWGSTTFAYEALFGTRGTKQATSASAGGQDDVWKKVKQALDGDKPIVASTGSHVVTVLRYSTAGGKKITVRDQATTDGGKKSGEKTYTLKKFNETFTYVRLAEVDATARYSEGIHLAGTWDTSYGDLTLVSHSKDKFTGQYGGKWPGKIPYAYEGGKAMVGKWKGDNGETGDFKLSIGSKRKTFAGTWGYGGSSTDGGAWTGKRK